MTLLSSDPGYHRRVAPPARHDGERLAYVMAAGDDRQATERAAEDFIEATEIHFAD